MSDQPESKAWLAFVGIREAVELKLARKLELQAEIAAIDRDLAEARATLSGLRLDAPTEAPSKPPRHRPPTRMTQVALLDWIRLSGWKTTDEVRAHFYGAEADGRSVSMLRFWLRSGTIRCINGKWAPPDEAVT